MKSRDFCVSSAYFYHYEKPFYQEAWVGAQLNIKSEDAYRLASDLAELTGENLTVAVTVALRERLDREQRARDREARMRKVREITADIRKNLRDPLPTSDHSWLYDEDGLPK